MLCEGYAVAKKSTAGTKSLSEAQHVLLVELLELSSSSDAINVLQFRAKHEDERADIDRLESLGFIEKSNNAYTIRLLALDELRHESPRAERLIHLCGHLYATVREAYKSKPGEQLKIADLARLADMPESDVRRALRYLVQTPVWMQHTNDLSSLNAMVMAGENILDHKSLADLIERLKQQAAQRVEQQTNLGPSLQPSEIELPQVGDA